MRVYDAKTLKYRDNLAEKRRRVLIFKILFFIGLTVAIIGFLLYLFFFSGFLKIEEISINDFDKVDKNEFSVKLDERLNSKRFGYVEHQKNLLFFDSDAFKAEILAVFPAIKNLSVSKKPPHALNITVTERITAGVWCFISGCKYFDKEGNIWGEAARSSGFLILVVDDLGRDINEIDRELLENIMLALERLKEMNILVGKFTIPNNFAGDFKALTSDGYELLFSMDSDIKEQIEALEIFLADKKGTFFSPQYIDLRINGRIYYK